VRFEEKIGREEDSRVVVLLVCAGRRLEQRALAGAVLTDDCTDGVIELYGLILPASQPFNRQGFDEARPLPHLELLLDKIDFGVIHRSICTPF